MDHIGGSLSIEQMKMKLNLLHALTTTQEWDLKSNTAYHDLFWVDINRIDDNAKSKWSQENALTLHWDIACPNPFVTAVKQKDKKQRELERSAYKYWLNEYGRDPTAADVRSLVAMLKDQINIDASNDGVAEDVGTMQDNNNEEVEESEEEGVEL